MLRGVLLVAWLAGAVTGCAADEGPIESELPEEIPEEDEHGIFARGGIELTDVTVDQGVAISLFDTGTLVEPDERNTTLVAGRPALFRAFWTVPDDWEPRAIEARLLLEYADGSQESATRELDVEDDSVPHWFDGTFSFYVPGELLEPDMNWQVTLYEVGEAPDLLPPAVVPRAPHDGPAALGADGAPRQIDLVIVPIDHQFDGGKDCPDVPPEFDEERLASFRDGLWAQNPVQEVRVTARAEPLVWDQTATNLSKILDELGKLRVQDDASPWTYYYGAIEPCDWGSEAGFAGLAYVPRETTKGEAWRRVSIGDIAVSESSTIETFVHEVGHNQERRHVPCGGPNGAVEDYPYRGGKLGNYGFDLLRWALHRPNERDYMSYCGPAWNSDYGWNQVLPVIEELTSWQVEGASADQGPGMVIGALYPDGTEAWWTMPGTPSVAANSPDRMEFLSGSERIGSSPMSVSEREDGSVELVAALPDDFDAVTQLRPSTWLAHAPVAAASIERLHDRATR